MVYPAPGGQGIEVNRLARTVSFDAQVLGIFALAEPPLCPAKAVAVSGSELKHPVCPAGHGAGKAGAGEKVY